MSQSLNIAAIQLSSVDQPDKNETLLLQALSYVPEDTDLVVTPENTLFFRLSTHSSWQSVPTLDSVLFRTLQQWCEQRNTTLLLTSPLKTSAGVNNATIAIRPQKAPEIVYRKIHLFDVDVEGENPVRESDLFVAGEKPAVIDVKGWKVGLSICYDLRFAELYSIYATQSVDLICVPSAFLVSTGEAHWGTLLRARAIESQAFIVAPAQVGPHIGVQQAVRETYGHSMIIDPWGRVLAQRTLESPSVVSGLLEKSMLDKVRRQIPMASHRRLSKSSSIS